MKRFVFVFVLAALAPATAFAGETSARDFDDSSRHGWNWEIGVGPWVGSADWRTTQTWTLGAAIDAGAHHVREKSSSHSSHSEKGGFDLPAIEGLRWCASLGCGMPLLLLFAPGDTFLGNELGVEVRGVAAPDGRVVVRPILRYASGRFRTSTLASLFLPEIGATWSQARRPSGLAFAWTPEAFDVLVDGRHLVMGFEPIRMGFVVPLDGRHVFMEAGTAITLRWIR